GLIVQRDVAQFAILAQRNRQSSAVKIYAIPCEAILLTKPETSVQSKLKLRQIFQMLCKHDLAQRLLFLGGEKTNSAVVLFPLADQTRRIELDFTVLHPKAVHE